jgi:hypothetical protein
MSQLVCRRNGAGEKESEGEDESIIRLTGNSSLCRAERDRRQAAEPGLEGHISKGEVSVLHTACWREGQEHTIIGRGGPSERRGPSVMRVIPVDAVRALQMGDTCST